jgi:hypothetical protein
MSGGYFEHKQYIIDDIAEEIDRIIARIYKTRKELEGSPKDPSHPDYNWDRWYNFSDETLAKFKEARDTIRRAAKMAQRIDWLLSGDDDEDSFHKRWVEELE